MNPFDTILTQRNANNTAYSHPVLSYATNSFVMFNSSGSLTAVTSPIITSASYAATASTANALNIATGSILINALPQYGIECFSTGSFINFYNSKTPYGQVNLYNVSGSWKLGQDIEIYLNNGAGLYLNVDGTIQMTDQSAGLSFDGAGNCSFDNPITASNIPVILAGSASVSTATSKIITFSIPMKNTSYVVMITGESALTTPSVSGKTINGFTASFGLYTGLIDWLATPTSQ